MNELECKMNITLLSYMSDPGKNYILTCYINYRDINLQDLQSAEILHSFLLSLVELLQTSIKFVEQFGADTRRCAWSTH